MKRGGQRFFELKRRTMLLRDTIEALRGREMQRDAPPSQTAAPAWKNFARFLPRSIGLLTGCLSEPVQRPFFLRSLLLLFPGPGAPNRGR